MIFPAVLKASLKVKVTKGDHFLIEHVQGSLQSDGDLWKLINIDNAILGATKTCLLSDDFADMKKCYWSDGCPGHDFSKISNIWMPITFSTAVRFSKETLNSELLIASLTVTKNEGLQKTHGTCQLTSTNESQYFTAYLVDPI